MVYGVWRLVYGVWCVWSIRGGVNGAHSLNAPQKQASGAALRSQQDANKKKKKKREKNKANTKTKTETKKTGFLCICTLYMVPPLLLLCSASADTGATLSLRSRHCDCMPLWKEGVAHSEKRAGYAKLTYRNSGITNRMVVKIGTRFYYSFSWPYTKIHTKTYINAIVTSSLYFNHKVI